MRILRCVAVATTAALLATGCSMDSDSDKDTPFAGPVGDGEGAVNVLAWPGYLKDANSDLDWVTEFEASTGCTVNLREFNTSDESVELMETGAWDVVAASGDAGLRLIEGATVQPVNTSLIPSYTDIFPVLKELPWNSVDGVAYGVPLGRGANLLMYNTKEVDPEPDSWADTFEPDSPYAGKITAYDGPIFIADAAVYLMATRPDLGITNPYALDRTQFDAAIALLTQQRTLVAQYWSDYLKEIQAFEDGTSVLGTAWPITVKAADDEGAPVKSVKPEEGVTGWSDSWMIAAAAHNINCAYKWIDWIVSPAPNAAAAEHYGQAPSNAKACDETKDEDHCDRYHADDDGYWEDVHYWTYPTAECVDGRTDAECVPYAEWSAAWTALRL